LWCCSDFEICIPTVAAWPTTRGRAFTISVNLGFGQQITELSYPERIQHEMARVGGCLAAACPIVNIEERTHKSRGVARRGNLTCYDWRIARLQPLAATRVGSVSVSSRWRKQLSLLLLCTAFVTWFGGGSGGGKLYIKSTVCRLGVVVRLFVSDVWPALVKGYNFRSGSATYCFYFAK
jgi:hypothetical protein